MNAIAEMNTDGQSANTYSFTPESLAAYVEHHVAARLADVVALADEWAQATCTCGGVSACLPCQYADRIAAAAVAADPAGR